MIPMIPMGMHAFAGTRGVSQKLHMSTSESSNSSHLNFDFQGPLPVRPLAFAKVFRSKLLILDHRLRGIFARV